MKYIEIDGKRYEVRGCLDCPCLGHGCIHPLRSNVELYHDTYYRNADKGSREGIRKDYYWIKCPLRNVEEIATSHDCDNCGNLSMKFDGGGFFGEYCPYRDRCMKRVLNGQKYPYWIPIGDKR